jgi:hypothetical protein
MNSVHRLVRTMAAWIQTLEARREELVGDIAARADELQALERQIAQERINAEAVAVAARDWAADIERQILTRKADLQAQSEALDAQLQAISESLKELPSARLPESSTEPGPLTSSNTSNESVQRPETSNAGTVSGSMARDPGHVGEPLPPSTRPDTHD